MNIIIKTREYIGATKYQIFKFLIVGVTSVIIDMSSLILLKERAGLTPVLSVATNQVLIIFYNFILNKYWSFATKKMPFTQFGRYLCLVFLNYFLGVASMYLFYNIFGLNYKIIRLFTISILVIFNFIFYKHWVYKEK